MRALSHVLSLHVTLSPSIPSSPTELVFILQIPTQVSVPQGNLLCDKGKIFIMKFYNIKCCYFQGHIWAGVSFFNFLFSYFSSTKL